MARRKKSTRKQGHSTRKSATDVGKRVLNLLPDPPDPRDYSARSFGLFGAPSLPNAVDYSAQTLAVGNQGTTGSCVGWATSYLRAWLQRESTGSNTRYSARFIWFAAREIDPWPLNIMFENAGTKIRDAFKVMKTHGAAPNRLWPFARQLPDPLREDLIRREALRNRIGAYYPLHSNADRRHNLARVGPFVIGVPVFSNWSTIGSDGVIPNPGGRQVGGHALLVVGYDDSRQLFKVQNSWSPSWGQRGYGYVSYQWMEDHSWVSWAADRL